MEATRPNTQRKSKQKKKRSVISNPEKHNENSAHEDPLHDEPSSSNVVEVNPEIEHENQPCSDSPPLVSLKELEILNNLDTVSEKESQLHTLNNLDLLSPTADELSKSKLNVFETSEDPGTSDKVEDVYDQKASEEATVQVEQLYPSLNEDYYHDLEVKSCALNRSISKISTQGDDLDGLSVQNVEAQLDTMASYIADDEAIMYPSLESYEVITMVGGEARVDGRPAINHDTIHHSSLQTFDQHRDEFFKNCYPTETAAGLTSQSHINFEELNKEILVDELRTFYWNPQLAENDTFLADFISVCQTKDHELYRLLSRYRESRQQYLKHVDELNSHMTTCTKTMEGIWTFTKEKKTETSYCSDFMKVSLSEMCSRCHCHQDVINEVSDGLRGARDKTSCPLILKQYNWKVSYYHVEQFLVKVVSEGPTVMSEDITAYFPSFDHLNRSSQLRMCIAILFYFKRQKEPDEVFAGDVTRWLTTLVGVQLRVATLLDHRFLLNHLLHSATGFSLWAGNFLHFVWGSSTYNRETCLGNPLVDHFLLMYFTLISPVKKREELLQEYESPPQDSDPTEWALLDEVGEASCDDKQLLERDYLALLGQFDFGMFFREFLMHDTPEEFMKARSELSEDIIMNILSICYKTIGQIRNAFGHLDFTRYRNFCQRNAKILTTFVRFTSDLCYFYYDYGGRYERWSDTIDTNYDKLITLHDHVFQEGFRTLAETSNVSLWQFLTDLPYHRIVIRILWKLYGFLHQVNPEKHIKSSILNSGSPYEIVTRLYKTARFQRRLEALSDEDCTFMVNVFCKMALSRSSDDSNFIKVIALDIYHIGVTVTDDKQSTDRACRSCLSNIIDHHPMVVSDILANLEQPTVKDLPNNLRVFRGISLQNWSPSAKDFLLLTSWLKTTPLNSLTNQTARIVIKNLNWNSYKGRLFLPASVHRKMAVVIVEAHAQHLADRPGYFIHASSPDYSKHVSNSDKNSFVHWCWDVLFCLCLHKTDIYEHDTLTVKYARQQSRQLKKQRSEVAVTAMDAVTEHVLVKQQTVTGITSPEPPSSSSCSSDVEPLEPFAGKWGKFPFKMRKESSLNPVCEALRTGGEMAAFVALSLTTIGHTVVDFQADGIQLLHLLHKSSQYRALLYVLSNLLPITLKTNCISLLLQLPDFLPCVVGLARADYNSNLAGRSVKPFTGFIVSVMTSSYNVSVEQGNLALKLFIQLFFAVPNFQSEASVIYILDKIFKVAFRYHGDEEYILEQLRVHFLKITDMAKRNSSKIMSLMSWFSGSAGPLSSLLQPLSNPGEVFWWSYFVTRMEMQPQISTTFFSTLVQVLVTNPDLAIDAAVRRTHELVVAEEVNSIQVPNVAIYKWGWLLQQVPKEHPLLAFAWQEFFKLYFSRITPAMAGVGYRFYQGMFQVREIKAIQQRLSEIATHFQLDEDQDNMITDDLLFRSKLSQFFNAMSLWAEETRLHEAHLYVEGLPPQYQGEILGDLMKGCTDKWRDYINTGAIDTEIAAESNEWIKFNSKKYSPRVCTRAEETAEALVNQLYNYVRTNKSKSEAPPPLHIPISHIPPLPHLDTEDSSSLITVLAPYLSKLRCAAEAYSELTSLLSTLDHEYIDTVPDMYSNRTVQKTELVPCYSRLVSLGKCTGPAPITMQVTQYIENTAVIEAVTENRAKYDSVVSQLKQDLEDDICTTTMFVEAIVSSLYWRSAELRELGTRLFYHVVESLNDAVWRYPPSQQIFAFSIDCLGQFFVRNNPDQTLVLLNKILSQQKFATLLAPLFQPNQGYEKFVEIYGHVTNALSFCEMDVAFMIMSKFDVRSWLASPHSTVENCRLIIDNIFTGFTAFSYQENNTNYLMFRDVLKLHLRVVLVNRASCTLQYTINKTLAFSTKATHHQDVWREISGVLQTDTCYQSLTLNTCHKVLYDISKCFLQFKKSILKASHHDMYAHWSAYSECILDLYSVLCTLYITSASEHANSNCHDTETVDTQISCILTMTCAVFGPWILVFEESCMPWTDTSKDEADKFLEVFCQMIALLDSSTNGNTVLQKFWWYYLEMLGHAIVPSHVIASYYNHVIMLPWQSFLLTLDVLHSMLKCVRQNRSNINLVIHIMTQVDWQKVVGELEKESHAFDMLIDVLITFALSPEIFRKFNADFIVLFRKFKTLDLSLCSDDGFTSILARIDKTLYYKQNVEFHHNTSHLIQFMGNLCRFKHHGGSYNKQITFFKHVVNILCKISNVEMLEAILQRLMYNMEQVFYMTRSTEHMTNLCSEFLVIFNRNSPAEPRLHSIALTKLTGAIREKSSVKEGFSFTQLSLYFLTSATTVIHNIRHLVLVVEVAIESYFANCQNSYPALSVSWATLNDSFNLSPMVHESFIKQSANERCILSLYLYSHHLLQEATGIDEKYSVGNMLVESVTGITPEPKEEQKTLLLWFKIFDILLQLHSTGIRSSALTSLLKPLPVAMLKLAEGRENSGIFGTSWFSKKSKLSLEFRLLARILATYILHQLNKDGSLRLAPGCRHNVSNDSSKSLENLRSLVNNKYYSSHIPVIQKTIAMVLDTNKTMKNIIELIRFLTVTYYDCEVYLSDIKFAKGYD